MSQQLKIAFFVGPFPRISKTFIESRVVELLKLGHEVVIYAKEAQGEVAVHPFFESHLRQRTHYLRTTTFEAFCDSKDFESRLRALLEKQPQATLYLLAQLESSFLLKRNERKRIADVLKPFWSAEKGSRLKYRAQVMGNFLSRCGGDFAKRNYWADAFALLEAGRFDVVQAEFGENGAEVAALQSLGAFSDTARYVTCFHGKDATAGDLNEKRALYKRVFALSQTLLVNSTFLKEKLVELGAEVSRIELMRIGVDFEHFKPAEKQYVADAGCFRFLSVCRLVEKKGLRYAIEAIAQLKDVYPKCRYEIVGDGPEEASLRQLVEELNVGDFVTFYGALNRIEVKQRLLTADAVLVPSIIAADGDQEGTPTAILEAMAMEKPVVSSRNSGIPELIEDGVTGILLPEKDVPALVSALKRLMDEPALALALGKAARPVVQQKHCSARLAQDLSALYTSAAV